MHLYNSIVTNQHSILTVYRSRVFTPTGKGKQNGRVRRDIKEFRGGNPSTEPQGGRKWTSLETKEIGYSQNVGESGSRKQQQEEGGFETRERPMSDTERVEI